MENATSIYNLQDEPSQRKMPVPMISYSDVLKTIQDEPVQPQLPSQAPVQPQPSPQVPVQQQFPSQVPVQPPFQPLQPQNDYELETKTDASTNFQSKSFQNDMLVLLSVYIVVHMATVQQWIRTKVPNLVSPDGAMSVMGMLMNGVLVIIMWNVSKKMVSKYMTEL